jgi:hypothetical protein
MRKLLLAILLTSSCLPTSQAQQVRLAKVGLGMTEAELKQVLDGASPHYTDRTSSFAGIYVQYCPWLSCDLKSNICTTRINCLAPWRTPWSNDRGTPSW